MSPILAPVTPEDIVMVYLYLEGGGGGGGENALFVHNIRSNRKTELYHEEDRCHA